MCVCVYVCSYRSVSNIRYYPGCPNVKLIHIDVDAYNIIKWIMCMLSLLSTPPSFSYVNTWGCKARLEGLATGRRRWRRHWWRRQCREPGTAAASSTIIGGTVHWGRHAEGLSEKVNRNKINKNCYHSSANYESLLLPVQKIMER